MKRVWIFLILALVLILPVSAATTYVSDGENLLSDGEEQILSQKLQTLSDA